MARPPRKVPGYVSPGIRPPRGRDYVIVELQNDSRVAFTTTGFRAPAEAEDAASRLNDTLSAFNVRRIASHLGMTNRQIGHRATAPVALGRPITAEFAHCGFVQVMPRRAADCAALVRRLNRSPAVWKAVVAPRPVPAAEASGASTASRNFETTQGYLHAPPNGIGAMAVWNLAGAKGRRVTICDIEGNWNLTHEDLPRNIRHIGGTLIPGGGWKNHGTAVLGEMISRPNGAGTVGICHQARAVVQSAMVGGVFNTAAAITNATRRLRAGDVILIELQATGPNGKYVAMQYWDDIFSAIRAAVDRGIAVVEAAGNGNENFNLPIFRNTGLQKDAGAIVVGAGVPPTNHFDFFGQNRSGNRRYADIGPPRSRIWFSNYGRIVNVQAWGWHVTSLGYGDAQGGNENRWYTTRFSGTSSASPIVTGAVACLQGRAKARRGRPLPPRRIRDILVATGTRQQRGPAAPLSQHIGPQPDLTKAIRRV